MNRFQKIYLFNTIVTGSLFAMKTAYVENNSTNIACSERSQRDISSGTFAVSDKERVEKFILMSLGSTAIGISPTANVTKGILHPITFPLFAIRIFELKTSPQYIGEGKFKKLSWDEVVKKL